MSTGENEAMQFSLQFPLKRVETSKTTSKENEVLSVSKTKKPEILLTDLQSQKITTFLPLDLEYFGQTEEKQRNKYTTKHSNFFCHYGNRPPIV